MVCNDCADRIKAEVPQLNGLPDVFKKKKMTAGGTIVQCDYDRKNGEEFRCGNEGIFPATVGNGKFCKEHEPGKHSEAWQSSLHVLSSPLRTLGV